MSGTYKDIANHHRFHDTLDKADDKIARKAELMDYKYNGAGYRYGNNRRYYSGSKVIARRARRAVASQELRTEIEDE